MSGELLPCPDCAGTPVISGESVAINIYEGPQPRRELRWRCPLCDVIQLVEAPNKPIQNIQGGIHETHTFMPIAPLRSETSLTVADLMALRYDLGKSDELVKELEEYESPLAKKKKLQRAGDFMLTAYIKIRHAWYHGISRS